MSPFDCLPDEVYLGIVLNLHSVQDLKSLQLVSRRFRKLARDSQVWRLLCFESSLAGRRHNQATIPKTIPPRQVQALQAEIAALRDDVTQSRQLYKAQQLAKWDPRRDGQRIDWFREYVARQSPVRIQWARDSSSQVDEGIKGIALHRHSDGNRFGVLRLEDRAVGIWDISSPSGRPDKLLKSASGLLVDNFTDRQSSSTAPDNALLDTMANSVCVDNDNGRAFFALGCQLNEIDIQTLQLVSCTALAEPITALSSPLPGGILIAGGASGLLRYDSRVHGGWLDARPESCTQPLSALHMPLSIVHAMSSAAGNLSSNIYVAGRHPSVLVYDQRSFPRVKQSIWSGATLSSLNVLPHILPQIPQSETGIDSHCVSNDYLARGHTVLAAGAKNGKGSLELYGIDTKEEEMIGAIRNRTMASRVKLLSVTPHGKRICISDADGNIKWFEHDGFSLVRQVNTNDFVRSQNNSSASSPSNHSPPTRRGIFGSRQEIGDVVQKLIPTSSQEDSNLLLWAGSRAGLLTFGRQQQQQDYQAEMEQDHIDGDTAEARKYEAAMRRLLEAQAIEVRRLQDFGM